MANVGIKASAYCLNYMSDNGLYYGSTTHLERVAHPDSEFIRELAASVQSYTDACRYAPNLTYIGYMTPEQLSASPEPHLSNLLPEPQRRGAYGEIMPEDEFIALMDICDVFDLIWLEEGFAASIRPRLEAHPLLGEDQLKRLEKGHSAADIESEIQGNKALPLYFNGKVVACCRPGHAIDENLSSHVLLENLACKAGGTLALLHLIHNAGLKPEDIDFVIECSEEAAGDMNQRGGGNIAKAIAESASCVNASGVDVRGFCAAPVSAIITAAGLVASGIRKNVAVISGGAIPKLYMNAREHVKKKSTPLENCLGCFGVLLVPEDGSVPVIRLDGIGKHSVGAGASPQAITSALVWEPLQKLGLSFTDIDKYAPELHIPEITVPAGAGNVPEANYKMIAALAVMKGQCERAGIADFVIKHGLPGFAHTQGHIPSGVPFIGHAVKAISEGKMQRAMIIGKGSLFLARLTNLADGASFVIEKASAPAESVSKEDVKHILLDLLEEFAQEMRSSPNS